MPWVRPYRVKYDSPTCKILLISFGIFCCLLNVLVFNQGLLYSTLNTEPILENKLGPLFELKPNEKTQLDLIAK